MKKEKLRRALFVGAFPSPENNVAGGMVTSCRALLTSSLPQRVRLDLLDSTQVSNPPPGLLIRLPLAAVRLLRFAWRLETNRPDVVLLFVAVGASIVEKGVMARYARLRRVPVIMFPRGGSIVDDCRRSAFTRAWARFFFRGANRLSCQAESWRRFAIDTLGFRAGDVTVIRNWTATPELLRIGKERVSSSEPVRMLFIGWLNREKGVFDLIEACRQLVALKHNFTLDVVGDGHAMPELRAVAKRYELERVVRFRSWLDRPALSLALRDAHIFVLPSWNEGFPNAMIEAMAARLPVVVTRVGAIPEVISDRLSGLLTAPRDVESLRDALAELLADANLRERLATEAHNIAARDFGVEAAVTRILGEIEGVIETARGHVVADDLDVERRPRGGDQT